MNRKTKKPLIALLLIFTSCFLISCDGRSYDQSDAQAVVDSLAKMLEKGDVGKIPTLIYAEDDQKRLMLDRCGYLLDRLQNLSDSIKETYPDEVDELLNKAKETAEEKVAEEGRRRDRESQWMSQFGQLMTDPFGVLEEQMQRVEVVVLDDERSAVTFDGKPAFGGIGLMIRQGEDNKWYFELPQTLPVLGAKMPQTEQEWQILGAMLKTIAKGIEWAEDDIESGDCETLDEVWRDVMENTWPGLAMQYLVYEQALDMRGKQKDETKKQPPSEEDG